MTNSTTTCNQSFFNPTTIGMSPNGSTQFASSTINCQTVYAGDASTTMGFTYGEMVNSIFLFAIFMLVANIALVLWIRGVKVKQY